MRNHIAEYIKGRTISSRNDFFETLNFIAPLIDAWELAKPKSGRQIMKFTTAEARRTAYTEFSIPKRAGGERKICAPVTQLKEIQSVINTLLQSIFIPDGHATGFVSGKNVRNNAMIHVGQTCILNIDIENFFPSITKSMVRTALYRELGDILQSRDIINIISRLCTVPDSSGVEVLPQGAPTSPMLSNIVLKGLDKELAQLALRVGYRYSRYADDMTFSHSKPIRKINPTVLSDIYDIIEKYSLKVNEKKTKIYVPGARQEVTGVVVNDRVNVPRSYVKQLRVLLHLWEKYGYAQAQIIFTRDFYGGVEKNLINVIRGKINYLEMIKGNEDSTFSKLKSRFRYLEWKENHNTIK